MRFGKFQSLFTFMVVVLQVAVNELVDADTSRTYPYVYQWPAIQWACEPLLDALAIVDDLPPLQRKTMNLCLKLRGGKLGGRDKAASTLTTSVIEKTNETKTETIVVAKSSTMHASESTIDTSSTTSTTSSTRLSEEYTFSVFQENDGSETDPDGIPRRYLKMQGNKRDQAKRALEATIEWRKDHGVDTILARPHPKFDICKDVFPHYFCGRDDSNHVILLQRPGLINLPLAHVNGLTGDELLFHYVYEMEYLWQIVERDNPDATMTSVIDLTGLNVSVLRKTDLLAVVKKFVSTMDAHFPQRSHRTFLINSPKWFGAMYKLMSPLLRESTKEKIQIYSKGKKQDEAMKKLLSESTIPAGKGIEDLPPNEMEIQLRSFCLARLDDAGVDMQTVISI
ncbi:CRAL/TRIO domain containing protein [Nitzschia inconspicua]|uniref:CRAL/TRIO domain containing protein n=1 Tax=Nitzschia inconspicua TaxID=303405 RepID=A0A9K3KFU4_9STRA|nr:CRAL/TRIO domain containing protein [Nitzschia inconspicua]